MIDATTNYTKNRDVSTMQQTDSYNSPQNKIKYQTQDNWNVQKNQLNDISHQDVMSSKSYELRSILKKQTEFEGESKSALAVNVNDWI